MRERSYHTLRPTKKARLPVRVFFVDTEVHRHRADESGRFERQELRLWCCNECTYNHGRMVHQRQHRGHLPQEFWDVIVRATKTKTTSWIVCHNASYDMVLLGLFALIDQGSLDLQFAIIDDPPTVLKLRYNSKCFNVIDSFNFFRCSVQNMGRDQQLPKLSIPDQRDPDCDWFSYCQRDVDILTHTFTNMFGACAEHDLGGVDLTGPATAWHSYLYRFYQKPIRVHDKKWVTQLERDSMYGGRVECFRVGRVSEPIWELDANSLYPAVMHDERFPCRLKETLACPSLATLKTLLRDFAVIASVAINSPDGDYPVKTNAGVVYAQGTFDTVLAGPELHRALYSDHITRCYCAAVYDQDMLFEGWVRELYALRLQSRQQGNFAQDGYYKLLLNGLCGKFAQKRPRWVDADEDFPTVHFGKILKTGFNSETDGLYRKIGGVVQKYHEGGEWYHSFPALTAYAMSCARERMRSVVAKAGSRNTLYMDTDSVHVTDQGLASLRDAGLVDHTALGKFKVKASADCAEYRDCRNYTFGSRPVIAGLNKDYIALGDNCYVHAVFPKIHQILPQLKHQVVTVEYRQVSFGKTYSKGSVGPEGWTQPFVFKEEPTNGTVQGLSPLCQVPETVLGLDSAQRSERLRRDAIDTMLGLPQNHSRPDVASAEEKEEP